MLRKLYVYSIIPIIALALLGVSLKDVTHQAQVPVDIQRIVDQAASPTVEPTQIPIITAEAVTPPDRVLPAVGGNASLVLGASVLVLIIIAGVGFSSRRRAKH